MKIFSIILSDITNNNADFSFSRFIEVNKLEWWRYTALNYFIATPDNYDVKKMHDQVMICFSNVISAVFEIEIKSWQGIGPRIYDNGKEVSFLYWFEKLKDPTFIPAWERKPDDPVIYQKPSERLVVMDMPKPEYTSGNSKKETDK